MSDASDPQDRAATPAGPAPTRRFSSTVEPAGRVRRSGIPDKEADAGGAAEPSRRPGDLPPGLQRRYFTEPLRGRAGLALYEGPGAKRPALHDHGDRLATDQTHPAVARDMALIAAHRGWGAVRVRGEDEFRREVWLQARALGLDVQGYKPRERDHQELARVPAAPFRVTPSRQRPSPAETRERAGADGSGPDRSGARDTGAAQGVLIATGEAPYRRREGAPSTPYLRLRRDDGRPLDVWGAALPQALARSGAKLGDRIEVDRSGVALVRAARRLRDAPSGSPRSQSEAHRATSAATAERFRGASAAQAARDPELRGAQSHLAVLNAVIDRSLRDPKLRAELQAEARELVAGKLAQGRRFPPARVRETRPVPTHDAVRTPERAAASERVLRR